MHFSNGDRTVYYAQSQFPIDFIHFVRLHYIPASNAPLAITALADYEAALLAPAHNRHEQNKRRSAVPDDREDLLSPESRLRLRPEVDVIKLPADYQEIVRRLRQKGPLHDVPEKQVKLAIRRVPTRAS